MGYSGIVTSDMFGLATAIDSQTFSLLENKRKLVSKEGSLSDEEQENLEQINLKLEGYGFRYEMSGEKGSKGKGVKSLLDSNCLRL